MLRASENHLHLLLRCYATHPKVLKRPLSTHIKEEKSTFQETGILPNGTIYERQNRHIEGITKDSDLELLEKGIRKTDEMTSNFTNYMYKFHRLPLTMEVINLSPLIRNFRGSWMQFWRPLRLHAGLRSATVQVFSNKRDIRKRIANLKSILSWGSPIHRTSTLSI